MCLLLFAIFVFQVTLFLSFGHVLRYQIIGQVRHRNGSRLFKPGVLGAIPYLGHKMGVGIFYQHLFLLEVLSIQIEETHIHFAAGSQPDRLSHFDIVTRGD